MKHIYTMFAVLVVMAIQIVGSAPISAQSASVLKSGDWRFEETFSNQSGDHHSLWNFEIVDDGSSTIVALGERLETDGVKLTYSSQAIVVIDRYENGEVGGIYLEADSNNGKQIEFNLNLTISEQGKQVSMKSEGETTSFSGKWVGREQSSELKKGNWSLREIVGPQQGSYNIRWEYQFNESKGNLYGSGHKTVINGRKAHPGELKTVCNIFLQRQETSKDSIKGTGTEKTPYGKTYYAAYEGWISPSGDKLVVLSFENDVLTAIIVGQHLK